MGVIVPCKIFPLRYNGKFGGLARGGSKIEKSNFKYFFLSFHPKRNTNPPREVNFSEKASSWATLATLSILFGQRGSPMWGNYARREKNLTSQFFFIFPPTFQKNMGFFSKIYINTMQFILKRSYFPNLSQQANFTFYFFPPTRSKNTLSDPVDQRIYWVSPNSTYGKNCLCPCVPILV